MLVDLVTWTGDGVGGKKTTRFQPVAIITKGGHHSDDACFWTGNMPAGQVKETNTTALLTNVIDSVVSDGFTTGSDNRVERSGNVFAGLVLGGDVGQREVAAVTWVGDDAAQRDIACGFTDSTLVPALVILGGEGAGWVILRTDDMPEGDGVANSHGWNWSTGLADRIYRFGPDYFSVDDTSLGSVNGSGTTYHAIVVSAAPPADRSFATFTYVGGGVASSERLWRALSEPIEPVHASVFDGAADGAVGVKGLGSTGYPQGFGQPDWSPGVFNATDSHWELPGYIYALAGTWDDSGITFYGYAFAESGLEAPVVAAPDSRIGHGKLGVRGNLRTFGQLIEQADAAREADLELRLGKIVSGFQLDQSNTYVASVTEEYLGFPRDLVGVRTFNHPDLDRVESLADCRANAGTFFYDISQVGVSERSWDDGLDWWDEQLLDTGIAAYFELADGTEETGAITATMSSSGAPTFVSGLNGNALSLNAASDYLSLSHADTNGAFDFGVGDFAIHVKVKRSATLGTVQVITRKFHTTTQHGFDLRFNASNVVQLYIGDGTGGFPNVAGTTAVTDTSWHSVEAFRVGGWVYLYLDGQLEASAYLPHTVTSTDTFTMGDDGGASFIGTIDQAVFHNSAALFLAQNRGGRTALFDGADFNAHWRFNGDATDMFGQADLTANNSPTYADAVRAKGAQLTLVTDKTDSPYFTRTITGEPFSPEGQSAVIYGKFRLDSGDGRSQVIYDTRNTTPTQNVSVYRNTSNKLELYIEDDSGNITQVPSVTSVTAGAGYHSFAAVIDRTDDTARLYLDGQLENSVGLTGTPDDISSLGTLHVGADFNGTGFNLDGRVDEVGFLRGRTWSLANAQEHHAGAVGGPPHAWMHGYDSPAETQLLVSAALVYHSNTAGSAALARTPIPSGNTDSWDVGAGFLYVHLPDDSNVAQDTVLASFGFYFGGRGLVHPNLGPDTLTDGAFESIGFSGPDARALNWVNEVSYGLGTTSAQNATTTRPYAGTYALYVQVVGDGSGNAAQRLFYQDVTGRQAGELYRLSGFYRNTAQASGAVLPLAWAGDTAGNYVDLYGRDQVGVGPALQPTFGEWRAFSFDFIAPASTIRVLLGGYAPTGEADQVVFDQVALQRIYSWQYREPRLAVTGAPKVTVGLRDPHFGQAKVGVGSVELLNADAELDPVLSGLEWMNQEARLRAGGRFMDGEALLYQLQHPGFAARIQNQEADDQDVTMELQDARATIHRPFPPNLFSQFVEAALDPAIDGKEKPVLIGADLGLPVFRIDLDANLKPTYLIADPLTLGLHSLQAVYAYTGKDAADQKDTAERVTLVESTDYSKDLTAGTITMLRDVGPIRITDENNELDFNDGSAQNATLTEGLYASWAALAAHIQTQMDAASGDTITCTYSESTHKLTVASDGVTLQLLTNSGANKERSAWATLGFDTGTDKTGATSYVGDDALFESPEKNLVVRVDATGLKDDSSGSFTGSAGAAINLAVDFFAFLWKDVLGFGLSLIDATTRAEARTTANEVIKAYISEKTSTGDIFEILERTSLAVIVVDGSGLARFKLLRNTLPSDVVAIEDRDIVRFKERRTVADSYATVSVLYDRDAGTGAYQVRIESSAEAKLNVRPDQAEFETFLTVANDAQTRAEQIATLAASRARLATVGLRGLLDESLVGDLVTLTRGRAPMGPGGTNAAQQYRVRELGLSVFEPGDSEAELVEHILVPGG